METLSDIALFLAPYVLAGVMVLGFLAMLRSAQRKRGLASGQDGRRSSYGNQITIVRRDQVQPEVVRATPVHHRVMIESSPDVNERTTIVYDARPAREQFMDEALSGASLLAPLAVPVVDGDLPVMAQTPAHWTARPVATASDLDVVPPVHPLVELPRHPVVQEFRVRLGLDRRAGSSLYLPAGHALIARDTGGGKTNTVINVVAHYLKAGARVWYGNPKFVPVAPDGLDMTPMIQRCERIAVKLKGDMGKSILAMLEEAMISVLDRVDESQETLKPIETPMVIVIEELKALLALWRKLEADAKAAEKRPKDKRLRYAVGCEDAVRRGIQAMEIILALGRELKVFLVVSAQDCQVQNIGLNQGSQGNFQWVIAHPDLDGQSLKNAFGISRDEELVELNRLIETGHDWFVMFKMDNRRTLTTYHSERVTNDWLMSMLQDVPVVQREEETSSPVKETEEAEPEVKRPRYTLIKDMEPVTPDDLAQAMTAEPPVVPIVPVGEQSIIQPGTLPPNVDEIIRVAVAAGMLMAQGVKPEDISQRKVAEAMRGTKVTGRHVTEVKEPLLLIKPLLAMQRDLEQPDPGSKLASGSS